MKLKTILSIMLLALGMQQAKANDGNKYLDVYQNATPKSFELQLVKKITFSEGNTIILVGDEEVVYPSAQMEKIAFSGTGTAIGKLPLKEVGLQYAAGTIKVQKAGLLKVYNTAGALVGAVNVTDNANVSLSNLPAGIYIVAIGNQTIKINKK